MKTDVPILLVHNIIFVFLVMGYMDTITINGPRPCQYVLSLMKPFVITRIAG